VAVSLGAWFRRDLDALARLRQRLVARYPNLHLFEIDDHIEAIGTVALGAADRELTRFSLRIILPNDYPRDLPEVYETKGRIPKTTDFHVNPGGSLCIGLPESIWLEHGKLDLVGFLDGPVRSYLVGICELEEGRPWPFGEWSHGSKGIAEFHAEYLGIADRSVIAQLLRAACRPQLTWRVLCPCRSGSLMYRCHGEKLLALRRRVPRSTLKRSAGMLSQVPAPPGGNLARGRRRRRR
jgi:hypothetical protein